MADYNIDEIVRLVKAALLAESQGVGEVPVVSSLDGINSLPALKNGNQVVEAPLELLSEPAVKAAEDAYKAIENVDEAAAAANAAASGANAAAESANEAATRVDESVLDLTTEKEIIAGVAEAEEGRVAAEQGRVDAESTRVASENTRISSENARSKAETDRNEAEVLREEAERLRIANENERETQETSRQTAETDRRASENERKQLKVEMDALNKGLKENPPIINDEGNWEVWDAVTGEYHDTGKTALGKSPIIVSGNWWIWNDGTDQYEDTGWSVSSDYQLRRENVESVLGGIPAFYIEEWKHTDVPFRSGSIVKFNQEFYSALKDTSVPPVPLLLLGEGIIAKVDEHTYATKGSYDAEGNKEDWKKIPYDELRLSSRYGTLNGEEVDVRTLATAEEVYQFEPHLYIDLLRGVIKGNKVDFKLPKKNVTDALGYVPASTAQHEALASEVQKQGVRLDSLESNALVSTYTLEQSSNPAFEVSNKNAAKLYASQMGGYLFYNGNEDGKVYAAKLNPYDWSKLADGTPVTDAIEVATETMVHLPDCHFKANGKTMNFGGVIPIDGGHTFGSPHWVGAYLGSIADGALHSRPNVSPSYSQTMESFWNYTQALHANKQYGLANYQFHCLINALFQASFGNLNSQEVIGAGWRHSSWQTARNVKMGLLRALGDGTGKVLYNDATIGNQYPVKVFGFEDLWGKLWEFRPNIRFEMRDGVRYAIVYDGNQVSNTAEGREFVTALQSASGAYATAMKLGEWWDMIPEAAQGGGESVYYCDGAWAATTGELLRVDGHANDGSLCGLSSALSSDGFSTSYTGCGARLAFWSEPEIVSGAQLVAMINS